MNDKNMRTRLTPGELLTATTRRSSHIDTSKTLDQMTPGELMLLEQDGVDYYNWNTKKHVDSTELSLTELKDTIRTAHQDIKNELLMGIFSKDLDEVSAQDLILYKLLREDQRKQLADDDASPGELILELYGKK